MNKKLGELIWLAIGGGVAVTLALLLVTEQYRPLMLALLGGSAVYLFALTEADESQPRALFGGHLGGAVIGILCLKVFGDALWVSVIAMVLTMVFMMLTRTIHPPAGATPLVMIHYHAGFYAFLNPVIVGIVPLFIVAVAWSRLRPGMRYPVKWWN